MTIKNIAIFGLILIFSVKGHTQKITPLTLLDFPQKTVQNQNKEIRFFQQLHSNLYALRVDLSDSPYSKNVLKKNMTTLLKINEEAEKLKWFALRYHNLIYNKLYTENRPLSAFNINILSKIIGAYFSLTKSLYEFSEYYPLSDRSDKNTISLFIATMLADQYSSIFYRYQRQAKIKELSKNLLLDSANKSEKFTFYLKKISTFLGKSNKEFISKKIKAYQRDLPHFENKLLIKIDKMLKQTWSYKYSDDFLYTNFFKKSFKERLKEKFRKFTNYISKIFGNTAGSIKWRSGYLRGNKLIIEELKRNLRPFDILTEKAPFILTDSFIPGFFGHNAIYLGTKQELIKLGLWEHPLIQKVHREIESGKVILEALRDGVQLNTIEHFFNVDNIALLRIDKSQSNARDIIERSLVHYKKKYDFNFDVSTSDKIVCSELIYHTFSRVNWPTTKRVGRWTIDPDNIFELIFYKDTPVKLIYSAYATSKKNIIYFSKDQYAKIFNLKKGEDQSYKRQYKGLHDKKYWRALRYTPLDKSIYDNN